MDLFRDIAKGKHFSKSGLKKEAKHELKELGGEKRAEAFEKKVKSKTLDKKMRCKNCDCRVCECE